MNVYVSHVVDVLKAGDEKRTIDFARTQHELQLKITSQTEVFRFLQKWCEEAANEISIALYRPAIRYQKRVPGIRDVESFTLIGEGGEWNRVEVTCAPDGKIVYSSNMVAEGRQSFNPSIENGDEVRWYYTKGIVTLEEMGELLLSVVTQPK